MENCRKTLHIKYLVTEGLVQTILNMLYDIAPEKTPC